MAQCKWGRPGAETAACGPRYAGMMGDVEGGLRPVVTDEDVRVVVEALPGGPASVSAARRRVLRALDAWHLDALGDTAALLVSELVTNAMLHTGADVEVRVVREADAVRVTVLDRSPRRPVRRRHGLEAGTGRGLGLVDTLALDWGTCGPVDGWAKGVWVLLPTDGARLPDADEGALYGEDWLAVVGDL